MEKQKNNFKINILKKFTSLIFIYLINLNLIAQTYNTLDYSNPKNYELGGVIINGANNLNNSTLLAISNLTIGEKIEIPGEKITKAITNLWEQGLFKNKRSG